MTITVPVDGPHPYEVTIGEGLSPAIAERAAAVSGARKAAIVFQEPLRGVVDDIAAAVREQGLEVIECPVPDAEEGKTLEVAGALWDRLGEAECGRRDVVIGVGGGAATDLAGFVAACWMRGITVIQVPTTLLAMVDAAVGGKTGVNTAAGKNLVGAFHEPDAVFIDTDRLGTLPRGEIVAGSAEIIKTGMIADPVILERYEQDPAACLRLDGHLPELIARSVAVKAKVVAEDLQEAGLREILNYGHTFGHAVELRERFQWRHGQAVAVGMMFAAYLAEELGLIDGALVERQRRILDSVGLPTTYEGGHFEELRAGMQRDKKNRRGHLRFVLLDGEVARMTRAEQPAEEALRAAYERLSGEATTTPAR
ncbi:3-dehydroquinate synthase [Corynebacterium uropygiale]|uniref:3-dehydroquinate synthase n=1 Tax=Corynebacterium uropygiale TaxID=1775911 RepID=A0A9X1QPR3_9CORY|nr:3-dehydroquinate synthase [Corynebacterium uropygiale]MCF4006556.1 3-dehydroquinate synthase [Corynebacterium uropygiale]